MMPSESVTDLRALLADVRSIAILGLSADLSRDSNRVAAFLVARGYDCVGVNPAHAGKRLHGMPVVARLADIGHAVDMVDIFRASAAVAGIVNEVLALAPRPRVIWMQLGVIDVAAKAKAEAAGLIVVMDECPMIVLKRG